MLSVCSAKVPRPGVSQRLGAVEICLGVDVNLKTYQNEQQVPAAEAAAAVTQTAIIDYCEAHERICRTSLELIEARLLGLPPSTGEPGNSTMNFLSGGQAAQAMLKTCCNGGFTCESDVVMN
eukprot:CAMPEP_0179933320 /NCGR_PEP_ID=MMETSP0983-20121128/11797_1 /TAXON_ID=483367 /ORGANISM="non described non described, Strain CCMP 2436" /LENGTH=121 /DNA_ID=CAMNT_0021838101 /DNA_START=279 /DNA_END=643 /DNA_ORIENTATION=-